MFKYVIRRIAQMIPVFLGVTLILFLLRAPGVLPGDPIKLIVGEKPLSPALRAQIEEEYHLNEPLPTQYAYYLGGLMKGDLGDSFQKNRPVTQILFDKFPNTARLALLAILLEVIIGILAGIISAVKQYSFWDVVVTLSTSVLVAVPVFWLGMLLQILFGIKLIYVLPGFLAVFLTINSGFASSRVWAIVDLGTGVPTFANLFAMVFLLGKFFALLKDYKARYMGIGEVDPEFVIWYEDKKKLAAK